MRLKSFLNLLLRLILRIQISHQILNRIESRAFTGFKFSHRSQGSTIWPFVIIPCGTTTIARIWFGPLVLVSLIHVDIKRGIG